MIGSGIHVVNYDECIQNQGLHAFWLIPKVHVCFAPKICIQCLNIVLSIVYFKASGY